MYHYFGGKNLGSLSTETACKFVDSQIKRINFLSNVSRLVFIREMQRAFSEGGTLLFKYRSDEFQRSKS
jgi:hypothetical protein